MAFKFGAFARGFAEGFVEDKREKEDEVRDLIKTSYASSLEEAKVLRKERKAKREQLKNIGSQLKVMGLNDSQAAGILAMGVDGAKRQIEILQGAAEKFGPDFKINDFVTAKEEAGLTMDDAIDRIMGTPVTPAGGAKLPEIAQVKTLFGTSDRVAREQLERMQGAFGEDYGQLQAEVSGERTYGALPEVSIDYTKLGVETPEDKLAREVKEAQLAKLNKEITALDEPDKMSATQEQTLVRGMNNILAPIVAKQFNTELDWDGTNYVLPPESSAKAKAAMEQSLKLARTGVEQIRNGVNYTDALGMQQDTIGGLQYSPDMVQDIEPITVDQIPNYNPQEQTPLAFATGIAERLNVAGMNPTEKNQARDTLRRALLDGSMDVSIIQANKIVNELIPVN
jgi:hypothetical protein